MERAADLTLLDVVRTVQDSARSDEEAVAVIEHMLKTRRVILSERFGTRRRPAAALA
jgi:hypothetical protein